MRAVQVVGALAWLACACAANGTRYTFYRSMRAGGGAAGGADESRRVFGGETVKLSSFPAACVLLDRYWSARCSAAVVAARWAITAAHCVTPHIAYVKYNAQHPTSPEGDTSAVQFLYRHPGYKVVQEDEGRGVDVTLLHHDVGLVRTRNEMILTTTPKVEPLSAMRLHNPVELKDSEVQVLGFGRTERSSLGEELFTVRLKLVFCERGAWFHCVCGVATARAGGARGVCSGDSGGPVMFRGAQVGVTSMGPLECATNMDPAEGATSVFTSLYNYADLVNATINDTEEALRMKKISTDRGEPRGPGAALLAVAALAHLVIPAVAYSY